MMAAFDILVQAVHSRDFEGEQKMVTCAGSLKKPYHNTWLENIVVGKFFAICKPHSKKKQNGRNVFCMDCGAVICPSCMPSHSKCRMLQIFRHCHRDVSREKDFCKVFDTTGVQQMYVNSQYVVNLKTRLDTIATKNGSAIVCHCEFCDHGMQKYYSFCSVHCKIKAARARNGSDAESALVRQCDKLPLIKIRTSSPRTTKFVPTDDDDNAIPTPTPTPTPPTTKRSRKYFSTSSKKRKTIPGTPTDQSEVEDIDTALPPQLTKPLSKCVPEIVPPEKYLSPPRRLRSPRRLAPPRQGEEKEEGEEEEVEVVPVATPTPTPPPSPSGNTLSRTQRKGKPVRSYTRDTRGFVFPPY